jgi:hypothetical protein
LTSAIKGGATGARADAAVPFVATDYDWNVANDLTIMGGGYGDSNVAGGGFSVGSSGGAWNVIGQTGAQGPAGPPGTSGPVGASGFRTYMVSSPAASSYTSAAELLKKA